MEMFTKPLTRAPWYILIKSFFVAIGQSYLHHLSHTFLKILKLLWGEIACQKRFVFYRWRPNIKIFLFYSISNDINFVPKYLDNALTDSVLTSRTLRRLLEEKAPVNDFVRTVPGEKYCSKYNRQLHHFIAMITPMSLQPWSWQIFILI